jgi:hypothetical protein
MRDAPARPGIRRGHGRGLPYRRIRLRALRPADPRDPRRARPTPRHRRTSRHQRRRRQREASQPRCGPRPVSYTRATSSVTLSRSTAGRPQRTRVPAAGSMVGQDRDQLTTADNSATSRKGRPAPRVCATRPRHGRCAWHGTLDSDPAGANNDACRTRQAAWRCHGAPCSRSRSRSPVCGGPADAARTGAAPASAQTSQPRRRDQHGRSGGLSSSMSARSRSTRPRTRSATSG